MARAKTTGRFKTRKELEDFVLGWHKMGTEHVAIAAAAEIDPRTVRNILGDCYVNGKQVKYKTAYTGAEHEN